MRLGIGKFIILLKWLFTKQPTSVALDITHRCNLKCRHCYWWRQDHPHELGDEEMIQFMRSLKSQGLRAAILYGGEPTLRWELCKAAGGIFDATLAFTNGTTGFPELDGGQWILSLDGPEAVNDQIRGGGVYREAVKNVLKASRPPIVHMTISQLNRHALDEFVEEMMALPVKGVGFSFYTPSRGRGGSDLLIPLEERDRVIMHLLDLRKRHGERVGFTRAMARQLLSDQAFNQWNSLSSCPVTERVRCFSSDGQPKSCTYGEDADCSLCGCAAVAAYRGAFRPFDFKTLKVILGLMIAGTRVVAAGKEVRPGTRPRVHEMG